MSRTRHTALGSRLSALVPPRQVEAAIALSKARGARERDFATPSNLATHAAALAAYLAELRDALALANALGRILVRPCPCPGLYSYPYP